MELEEGGDVQGGADGEEHGQQAHRHHVPRRHNGDRVGRGLIGHGWN